MTGEQPRLPIGLLVLFGLLLATAAGLSAAGLIRVGGPGGTALGERGFAAVLGGILVVAVASHLWPSLRVPLLLGASLALVVGLHGPVRALGALAIWSAFYAVVHLPANPRSRSALIAVALVALWAAPWIAWRMDAPAIVFGILTTALLASGFVIRSLLYAYEATAKKEQMAGAGYPQYLLYLLAAPLCIVHFQPVGFVALHRGLGDRSDPALLRRGVAQVAQGIVYLAALNAGRSLGILLTHPEALQAAGEYDALTLLAAAHSVLLGFFLELAGHLHLMIGMMRVVGFDIPAGFNRPYASRNILEFWRRWNTYFRDFLTALAYYPVAARLKRRPLMAVLAGSTCVFILSGTAHALIDLAGNPGGTSLKRFAGRHLLFVVYGALVAAWMVKETVAASRRGRSRAPVPAARGAAAHAPGRASGRTAATASHGARLREILSVAVTLTVFAVLYLFFRRPLAGSMRELAGALLRPPW